MVFSHVASLGGFCLTNLRVECFDYMQKYPRFAELSVCNCMTAAGHRETESLDATEARQAVTAMGTCLLPSIQSL